MHPTPPRPSLPPPRVPTKLVAETRIRILQNELAQASDPVAKSALQYEIAALTEHKLGSRDAALKLYRAAHHMAPTFRPPLYALLAAAEADGDDEAAGGLLDAELNAARTPAERASALVDKAVWSIRRGQDAQTWVALIDQALDSDPKCHIALILLERHHYAASDQAAAEQVADARSASAHDPALKSALLVEVAQARERDGDTAGAIEILRGAASLPQGRWYALERMERLALLSGDSMALVEALEGRAVLAALAARDERNRVTLTPRSIRRFRNAEHALKQSAALWRQAARARAFGCSDPVSAQSAYDQALSVFPNNLLLHQEKMFACELADDSEGAATVAKTLLERNGQGAYAATLHLRVAEQAQRSQNPEAARDALQAAIAADPDSPALAAMFDDWQADNGDSAALLERLLARAREQHDPDALLRAIDLSLNVLNDAAGAAAIVEHAIDGDHRPVMWRMLLAAAYKTFDHPSLVNAATQLCQLGVSDAEHSVLMRERHQVLRHDIKDATEADAVLREALDDVRCRQWAPDCARLMALTSQNYPLLCAAHRTLANSADDDELRAAHLSAGARAALRAKDEYTASVLLRDALERDPTNPYAVAMLEDVLLRRGEAHEAVQLLRATAEVQANVKRSEIALLHAGAAAEIAGDLPLATRSYEESADKDPTALAPLWSLRRIGERNGDATALLTALEGLAARERQLGGASVAALEVGEHLDALDKPELAFEPLAAALQDRAVAGSAALSLATLPLSAEDHAARGRALLYLQHNLPEGLDRAALRARIALHSGSPSPQRDDLIADLLAWDPTDRYAHVERVVGAETSTARDEARAALANATDDAQAAAHVRMTLLHECADPDAATAIAERIGELVPDSLLAALAREHALHKQVSSLEIGADPEALAYALLARADLTSVEHASSLRAAAARLLISAERTTEAVDVARTIVARDPDDFATWDLLRGACHLLENWDGVVEACDALASHCEGVFRAQLLEESACVLLDQLGRANDAEKRLRDALAIDPARMVAFDRLHDILTDRQDEAALAALIRERIDLVDDPDELVDLFYEQARLHRSAGDRPGALAWIDSLLMLHEHHLGALGLAAEIHVSMEQWALACQSLQRIARADGVPATQKRLSHIAAADFLERRLGNLQGAHDELATLASGGLGDAGLYSRMANLALRVGDTEAAVRAHASGAELTVGAERAMHERLAGNLLRERIGDRARAVAAYRRALEAQPDDLDACSQLIGLNLDEGERTQALADFESAVRASMVADPTWAPPWQKLKCIALWTSNRDMEHVVLSAMVALGVDDDTDPDDRARLEARLPEHPSATLDDQRLMSLRAQDDRNPWAEFASHVSETIASLQHIEAATYGGERKHRVGKRDPHPVRDAIAHLIGTFGLSIDTFYAGHKESRGIDVLPSESRESDWLVGPQACTPLSAREKFSIAQRAMAIRMRVYPLMPCPRDEAVTLLYGVAAAAEAPFASVSVGDVPLQDAARAMSRRARKAIAQLTPGLSAADAPTYVDAANQTCARAGLLVTGNLLVALEAVLGPGYSLESVHQSASARELVLFSISHELLALRRAAGVAI